MIPLGKLLLVSVTAFGLWKCFQFVLHVFTSPLRHLRGPKGASWIYGNLRDAFTTEHAAIHEEWVKQYGNTLAFKGFLCSNRLFTVDTRAINHILTHSNDYQKTPLIRYNLSHLMGNGVLTVEGAQHRQQRRIMNPAFGPAQIRALTDIFLAKAVRLRDVWSSEIAKDSGRAITGIRLDIVPWLSRMTLDVIGLAGFNYDLDSLSATGSQNELNQAYATIYAAVQHLSMLPMLRAYFPPLRLLPSKGERAVQASHRTLERIGKELLLDAKAAAQASATRKGEIEKNSLEGRDLLSLLVKANMATDIPENQRLADKDVLAQVLTFFIAGHETTSTATTWTLHALTEAPEVQKKLREELLSVNTETPSMDQLMALPYLDAVVRESLRAHSPIPNTMRIAMKDDVLPVGKSYTDKYGVVHDSIRISKGDPIFIPIQAINRSQELYGPDAHEFKPERWENIPETALQVPGVWGHVLSFLDGPRACIGYRFSLVEIKALLFTLVRAFEFEPAVPVSEIGRRSTIVQQSILRSDPERGPQLPVLIKPYQR